MNADPVVEEVRAIRQAYAASFNYDLSAMVEDLRRRQREEGHPLVSRPPKPSRQEPARAR